MPSFGNVFGDDPLGIALKDRAQQQRFAYQTGEGWGIPQLGPLPDPAWQGLFQALSERGVDRLVGGEAPGSNAFVGVEQLPGKYGASESGPQGFAPATGERSMLPGYGAPDDRNNIIRGLNQAYIPMGQGYQSHNQWMAENAPTPGMWQASQHSTGGRMRIQDQRGTQGFNQSQRYRTPNPNE